MIRVSHLTKRFGGVTAVDDVSFHVAPGEIVGFLGPNGAGKTTTMRMLSGYIPATGGTVEVAGRDVQAESLAVRERIGYLPEKCPLYLDMRVNEYLHYRARLKGLSGKRRRERVATVRRQCGIEDMQRRVIGTLSKGYRQRVGLADALVHSPDLLILDEPTQGLDPNQIRQVRQLISELARDHTILLSTHILPEVEMTCRKVIIINRGRIIASDPLDDLRAQWCAQPELIAEIRGPRKEVVAVLRALPDVRRVRRERRGEEEDRAWLRLRIEGGNGCEALGESVFRAVRDGGWDLRLLHRRERSLEDVFVEVTQRDGLPGGTGPEDTLAGDPDPDTDSNTGTGLGSALGSEPAEEEGGGG